MVLLRNPTLVVKALCAEPDQLGQARILGDLADLPQHPVEAVLAADRLDTPRGDVIAVIVPYCGGRCKRHVRWFHVLPEAHETRAREAVLPTQLAYGILGDPCYLVAQGAVLEAPRQSAQCASSSSGVKRCFRTSPAHVSVIAASTSERTVASAMACQMYSWPRKWPK